MRKQKLLDKDKKLVAFVKKGGRKGAKKDFVSLLKKASQKVRP